MKHRRQTIILIALALIGTLFFTQTTLSQAVTGITITRQPSSTETPSAVDSADSQLADPDNSQAQAAACSTNAANVLANPSFESGKANWTFYTTGSGNFSATGPAAHCDIAARLTFNTVGNNMQLYQQGFSLKSATKYRLSFSGYSNSGHDLQVTLQKHKSPYTKYGLNNQAFNLTNNWQNYAVEFTTTGFSGTTTGSRLMFWFVGNAANGDIYWLDNVVLEQVGGSSPTATPTPGGAPTATPTSGGGGGGDELLVFDWNQPVTESHKGFPFDQPPKANGDWTKPVNYAQGTLYFRAEIFSQPVAQNMKLQFCFWQAKNGYNFELETCGPVKDVRGTPGTVATWSAAINDIWKKDGKPLEWDRARFRNGAAIKNSSGLPVSNYNGWNWNREDPKKWYPLNMRFTVVVVAKGGSFSGWQNYIK